MTICTSVSKNNQFINKVQSIHIIGDHVSTSIANCRNIGYIITWKNILVLVPKKNTRETGRTISLEALYIVAKN